MQRLTVLVSYSNKFSCRNNSSVLFPIDHSCLIFACHIQAFLFHYCHFYSEQRRQNLISGQKMWCKLSLEAMGVISFMILNIVSLIWKQRLLMSNETILWYLDVGWDLRSRLLLKFDSHISSHSFIKRKFLISSYFSKIHELEILVIWRRMKIRFIIIILLEEIFIFTITTEKQSKNPFHRLEGCSEPRVKVIRGCVSLVLDTRYLMAIALPI